MRPGCTRQECTGVKGRLCRPQDAPGLRLLLVSSTDEYRLFALCQHFWLCNPSHKKRDERRHPGGKRTPTPWLVGVFWPLIVVHSPQKRRCLRCPPLLWRYCYQDTERNLLLGFSGIRLIAGHTFRRRLRDTNTTLRTLTKPVCRHTFAGPVGLDCEIRGNILSMGALVFPYHSSFLGNAQRQSADVWVAGRAGFGNPDVSELCICLEIRRCSTRGRKRHFGCD